MTLTKWLQAQNNPATTKEDVKIAEINAKALADQNETALQIAKIQAQNPIVPAAASPPAATPIKKATTKKKTTKKKKKSTKKAAPKKKKSTSKRKNIKRKTKKR
jgi:hypothetical protein